MPQEFDLQDRDEFEGKNLPAIREDLDLETLPELPQGEIIQRQFALWAQPMIFSKEELDILRQSTTEDDVDITGDGIPYIPWELYQSRFLDAFGGDFRVVPESPKPYREGDHLIWGFYLVVKGQVRDYALGGAKLVSSNRKMSWDDVAEAAKSRAIKRLGKRLGMFPEIHNRRWVAQWKEKWADKTFDKKKEMWIWTLKNTQVQSQNGEEEKVPELDMLEFLKAHKLEKLVSEYQRIGDQQFKTVLKSLGVRKLSDLNDTEKHRRALATLKTMQTLREPGDDQEEGE